MLIRVKIRSLEVIEGKTSKIEALFEALGVIIEEWGKMDHHLCDGSLLVRLTTTVNSKILWNGTNANSSSFAKH